MAGENWKKKQHRWTRNSSAEIDSATLREEPPLADLSFQWHISSAGQDPEDCRCFPHIPHAACTGLITELHNVPATTMGLVQDRLSAALEETLPNMKPPLHTVPRL